MNYMKKFLIISAMLVLSGCGEQSQTFAELEIPKQTETETARPSTEAYNPIEKIKFSFIGDCTLATQMGQNYEGSFNWYAENYEKDYFFEKTYPYVCTDDFTIANCENVFTDSALKERNKGYTPAFWFRSESENAQIFSEGSIEAVSLANNHTYDYNEQGMTDTVNAIESVEGLEWGGEEKDLIFEKNGVKISVICDTLWGDWDTEKIIKRIENMSLSTDIQIVFFHGGEEAVHKEEYWKIQACHQMADAGADLIIGGHPHVLQPLETYNGTHIVYSIGNFCFGGNRSPENRTIIYQETFTFNKDTKQIESRQENIIPFYVFTGNMNNFQPSPIKDETQAQKVLDFMYRKSNTLF